MPLSNDKRDEMMIEMHSNLKTVSEFCKVNYKAIHGNGKPGLIEDVEELKTMHKKEDKNFTAYIALGGFLTGIGALLYNILT
jgi:hypothetical protein